MSSLYWNECEGTRDFPPTSEKAGSVGKNRSHAPVYQCVVIELSFTIIDRFATHADSHNSRLDDSLKNPLK
jgi:hypothetical protein